MPALDKLITQAAQQQSAPEPPASASALSEISTLLETIASKLVDLEAEQRSLRDSISQVPRTTYDGRLNAIESTLKTLSETVSSEQTVKLASGETVSKGQLDALALVKELKPMIEAAASAIEANTKAVRAKSAVTLDADKVAEVMSARVVKAQGAILAHHSERTEAVLTAQAARMEAIGTEKAQSVAKEAQRATQALERATETVSKLERLAKWETVGKVASALVPVLLVVAIVGSLFSGAFQALGLAPIFGWVWSSFTAASAWYWKVLIALAGLATLGALVLFSGWLARKVKDQWDRW